MKIKRIECEQFAGLLDKEIEFESGLNIVIGSNESGKSTMADLVYQMLFKDIKLDGRSDADFIDKYFPKKISGPQGDVIDGVLVFETDAGKYKLRKEWEKGEGTCRLTLPDGTSIKGNAAINEVLKKELVHRSGVYNEIVFATQKSNQIAVESIMRAVSKKGDPILEAREDLSSALTKAALETGGVSLDKLEKAIKANIDELGGRWDLAADAPEGGPKRASYKNAWSNGAGTIVKAYYAADDIRSKQLDAQNAERTIEIKKSTIHELLSKKKEVEQKRELFQKYSGLLGQLALLLGAIRELDIRIIEQEEAYINWPKLMDNMKMAKSLELKQKQAAMHALYLKAVKVQEEYISKKDKLSRLNEVDSRDVKQLSNLILQKQREEGKLSGMNLVAKINQLGSDAISIKALSTGDKLDIDNGELLITEAVSINIPGVIDMQLVPQGIDICAIQNTILDVNKKINALYNKYNVKSLDELNALTDEYNTLKQNVESLKLQLERILGDYSWDEVKTQNDSIPSDIESELEIANQVRNLCGTRTIEGYIGGIESTINSYEDKYISLEKLLHSIDELKKDKYNNQLKIDSMDEIPKEFQGIDDPEQYNKNLLEKIADYDNQISKQDDELRASERTLGEKSSEEYSEELEEREAVLETLKAELRHWLHIYDVFCNLKEQVGGNPVEDIELKFREYMDIITQGRLKLDAMDDKLNVRLASGQYALSYDILSEGTKDTISLAFRLAMLEHLYPKGNGLAIFDDPFTDMDNDRAIKACKLIQKFAENNQVIFITCNSKYKDYLDGNVIYFNA